MKESNSSPVNHELETLLQQAQDALDSSEAGWEILQQAKARLCHHRLEPEMPSEDESEEDPLAKLIRTSLPAERLQKLGDQQAELLAELISREQNPTQESLENLLYRVEAYYPEELIPLSGLFSSQN